MVDWGQCYGLGVVGSDNGREFSGAIRVIHFGFFAHLCDGRDVSTAYEPNSID